MALLSQGRLVKLGVGQSVQKAATNIILVQGGGRYRGGAGGEPEMVAAAAVVGAGVGSVQVGVLLVLPRSLARGTLRIVRLGGPKVRKTRDTDADVHEAGDVCMHRDSSLAPLLDLLRGVKAVTDVFDSMIR